VLSWTGGERSHEAGAAGRALHVCSVTEPLNKSKAPGPRPASEGQDRYVDAAQVRSPGSRDEDSGVQSAASCGFLGAFFFLREAGQ